MTSMWLVKAIICLIVFAAIVFWVGELIGDIVMMKIRYRISWRESIRCGWLYFIDKHK